MARQMTVVAFEEEEKVALRTVYESKRVTAMVKPVADELRTNLTKVKSLSQSAVVTESQAKEGKELLERVFSLMKQIPDSEAKNAQREAMEKVRDIFDSVLKLSA